MALPTTSLPIADDSPAAEEYKQTITDALAALANRNQTNWFSVAGQLLNPGRTGNAGEAIGRTADVIGQQIEQQRKEEPTIAQMRAQLSGTKYQMELDSKALKDFTNIMGASTSTDAVDMAQNGKVDLNTVTNLAKSLSLFSQSPKVLGLAKSVIDATTSVAKANADVTQAETGQNRYRAEYDPNFRIDNGTAKPVTPYFSLPVQNGTITSPYGQRQDPFNKDKTEFHPELDIGGKEGSPVTSIINGVVSKVEQSSDGYGNRVFVKDPKTGYTTYYGHLASADVKEGDTIRAGTPIGTLGSTGKSTGPHVAFGIIDPNGKPADPRGLFETKNQKNQDVLVASNDKYAGLPLAEANKQRAKDIEKDRDLDQERQKKIFDTNVEEGKSKVSIINTLGETSSVQQNNIDARNLANLISKNRDVMDLLNKTGALGQIMQNGMQTPVGSFSVDINAALARELPPEKQAVARQIEQLISKLNQNVMKEGKSIYGPAISNTDSVQMAKPGFQASDPSGFVLSMSQKMILQNTYNEKIKEALDDWRDNHPSEAPEKFFRSSNPVYKNIIKEYMALYSKLPEANSFYPSGAK